MVTILDTLRKCRRLLVKAAAIADNRQILDLIHEVDAVPESIGQIRDGYHTFDELYEHRFQLYIALCKEVKPRIAVFKTRKHSDGTMYEGWFLLMMELRGGKQISYHLPMRLWDECDFSERSFAPPFDGHTSADVLERLKSI